MEKDFQRLRKKTGKCVFKRKTREFHSKYALIGGLFTWSIWWQMPVFHFMLFVCAVPALDNDQKLTRERVFLDEPDEREKPGVDGT